MQIYTNILHMYTFLQTRDFIKIDKISREANCTNSVNLFLAFLDYDDRYVTYIKDTYKYKAKQCIKLKLSYSYCITWRTKSWNTNGIKYFKIGNFFVLKLTQFSKTLFMENGDKVAFDRSGFFFKNVTQNWFDVNVNLSLAP